MFSYSSREASRFLAINILLATAGAGCHGLEDHEAKLNSSQKACTPSTFESLLPKGSSVVFASYVEANGTFTENSTNAGISATVSQLPELCAAKFTVPSSNSSTFDFALFLPAQWNERFMGTGNGGFGGYIDWSDMAQFSHYGFASMSTNTGHYSGSLNASWALNNSEAIVDWGYRALHESTVLSKRLISAFYQVESRYNYFSSCSNGGRQGLKEVTAYPDDYDGVINGAPAWSLTHLFTWAAEVQSKNVPGSPGYISETHFQNVTKEIVSQCDPQDGLADGIIQDPRRCHFVPEKLLCNGTQPLNGSTCLSPQQLSTLYHVLNDWVDTNQTFVSSALDLGAEYILANPGSAAPYGLAFLRNFVFNTTSYGIEDFDYLKTLDDAETAAAYTLDANFDVEPFRARGGKILQYHGLADELIPSGNTLFWRSNIQQRLQPKGLSVDDWYRLFLVPGMNHCVSSSTGAPWYFAGVLHQQSVEGAVYSTPGFEDSRHDVTLAMMEWVEKGIAPSDLIATKYTDDVVGRGVEKQRPLCPYPQSAEYKGYGDVDVAENWRCS